MPSVEDITSKRFGRLVAITVSNMRNHRAYWLCQCDCGKTKVVRGDSLRSKAIRSCGCLNDEKKRTKIKHGAARRGGMTSEYSTWNAMKQRCTNPNDKAFKNYGGRGISVCKRWLSFKNFIEDMGPRPKGHWLERIKNDRGYKPSNCEWVTPQEQATNKRPRKPSSEATKQKLRLAWIRRRAASKTESTR